MGEGRETALMFLQGHSPQKNKVQAADTGQDVTLTTRLAQEVDVNIH